MCALRTLVIHDESISFSQEAIELEERQQAELLQHFRRTRNAEVIELNESLLVRDGPGGWKLTV